MSPLTPGHQQQRKLVVQHFLDFLGKLSMNFTPMPRVYFNILVLFHAAANLYWYPSLFFKKIQNKLCLTLVMLNLCKKKPMHLHFLLFLNINSLRPSDVVWQWSLTTLAQVMACCLMAPSHYLNQCWLIISKVLWQAPVGHFKRDTPSINWQHLCENCLSKISRKSQSVEMA